MVTKKDYAKLISSHGHDKASDIKKLMEMVQHPPHFHMLQEVNYVLSFQTSALPEVAGRLSKNAYYRSDACRFEQLSGLSFRVWGETPAVYKALSFLLDNL